MLRAGAPRNDFSCLMQSLWCGACYCGRKTLDPIRICSSSFGDYAAVHTKIPKVVLKKGKTQLFKGGTPMVYTGAVDRIVGRPPPQSGDIVLVTDGALHTIAWGMYNSVSMFCVRIMQMEDEVSRDASCFLNVEKLLESRISAAMDLRTRLGLPAVDTNVYRLVNSEGDRLSGLIVDIFGEYAVVASSAAWVEKFRSTIETTVKNVVGLKHVFWKSSAEILKEEGLDVKELESQRTQFSAVTTDINDVIQVVENGIIYKVSLDGQKTGFYADQRDNRRWFRSIARDRAVLDLCCYSGAFALNAAMGGARHVTGVDSSLPALELANENLDLNKFNTNIVSFVKADVTDYMKAAISEGHTWDLVVLDPPKLAPSRKVLQRATGMYRNLNSLAMRVTKPHGLLMTCSCSGAMAQSGAFLDVLQAAASSAGKKITQLRYAGAASDHTIDPAYPEGAYLTNVLVSVV